jgi:ribulose-phosphate 3-epimerase
MSYIAIVPAIIPTSEAHIIEATNALIFSRELQIDVVDGVFTPTTSWPYLPQGDLMAIKSYTDRYTLEIDLMVQAPVVAAKQWVKAGADMLVFHVETLSLDDFVAFKQTTNVSLGVAFHGDTPLEVFLPYVAEADYIQVMGVETIGAQGQSFDNKSLEKIATLRKLFPLHSITVDGGVNKDTIKELKKAGADRFIAGSAIVKQTDPYVAYLALKEMVSE